MVLHERLHELELRHDTLQAEDKSMISPHEERERLLKQVNTTYISHPFPNAGMTDSRCTFTH